MKTSFVAAAISGIVVGITGVAHAAPQRQADVSLDAASTPQPLDGKSGSKHACKGQNACKGQGGCKSDKHTCKGQNACKGQGGCKG